MRRTLYHVTPSRNLQAIAAEGIDPGMGRGRLIGCYWVTEAQLLWAIFHVSARHHVACDALVVYSGWFDANMLVRTGREGVFRVTERVQPNDVFPITRLIGLDEI